MIIKWNLLNMPKNIEIMNYNLEISINNLKTTIDFQIRESIETFL